MTDQRGSRRQVRAERGRGPALLVLALLSLMLASCGGAIRADELRRGVESLGSLASEGALVADGAARDRTKRTFTRVQARTLGEQAQHEAEKISDASAPAALARAKVATVTLATDVGDALGELQTAPGDAASAARAGRTLRELAQRAKRLAGEL